MSLTKQDLTQIKLVVESVVEEKLEEKLNEKLKFLPTKDEFYTETAKLMKEVQDMREEQETLTYRVSTHSDQIDALEKIHPSGTHTVV